MSSWRTPIGLMTITLWLIILVLSAFGCGLSDITVRLPNHHQLVIEGDRGAWLMDSTGREYQELNVIELSWDDLYVFGRSLQNPSYRYQYRWFVLDTGTGSLEGFTQLEAWKTRLDSLYIFDSSLNTLNELRRNQRKWWLVFFLFFVLWSCACLLWYRDYRLGRRMSEDRL